MISLEFNTTEELIQNRLGITYGKWFGSSPVKMKYTSTDKCFIKSCEINENGTYHIKLEINMYAEWVQLCESYGLWLRGITTTDNLSDDGLIFIGTQVIDMEEVILEELDNE